MGYSEDYDLIYDESNVLHKKVIRALSVAAKDVVNEDPATANHAERLQWAGDSRANPLKFQEDGHRIMPLILDNTTVAAAGNAATDNDVQFVVNGLVNTLAGVS